MSSEDEDVDSYTRIKQSAEHYLQTYGENLSGCVKKKISGKMRWVSLQRWKHIDHPKDVFFLCVRPFKGWWCQVAIVNISKVKKGCLKDPKVFCMNPKPCWQNGGCIE